MRLFLIGWSGKELGYIDIARQFRAAGHEIAYWTGDKITDEADPTEFPGTIFQELSDAVSARPASGVSASGFPPPSRGMLRDLAPLETLLMTNMNKKLEYLSATERKRRYTTLVQYWDGVLAAFAPDAIIFGFIPHTVYDLVLYGLARRRGVETVMPNTTMIFDRLFLVKDYEAPFKALVRALDASKGRIFGFQDLSGDIQAYYEKAAGSPSAAMPRYMVQDNKKYSGLNLLRIKARVALGSMRDMSFFGKASRYFLKKLAKSDLKKEYESVAAEPDTSAPYVYVPLNYQPECTTSPLGGVYADQILMIETLAAALPKGWRLYVKEHPYQWLPRGLNYFSYRYEGFYRQIADIPNVSLVPFSMNSYVLTDHARAVATVTGTPGFEALLRGKPTLLFGAAWYKDHPELFRVDGVPACREALERIAGGFAPSKEESFRFLHCLEKVCFRGYIDGYTRQVSTLSREESVRNIAGAILGSIGRTEDA